MSMFPDTPTALLTRIAANVSGEDEAFWYEFVELYEPTMRTFLTSKGIALDDIDDIIQDIFAKLVDILRNGGYNKEKGRFRTYLSHILYNEVVDRHRRALVRKVHLHQPLNDSIPDNSIDPACMLEIQWKKALHASVVDHILTKTALSDKTKLIFRELEESGDTCEAVAKRLKLSASAVRQVKSRVSHMVTFLETRFL